MVRLRDCWQTWGDLIAGKKNAKNEINVSCEGKPVAEHVEHVFTFRGSVPMHAHASLRTRELVERGYRQSLQLTASELSSERCISPYATAQGATPKTQDTRAHKNVNYLFSRTGGNLTQEPRMPRVWKPSKKTLSLEALRFGLLCTL